ncbi:Superkiller protein 3, partial [Dimargaris cristalligena]
MSAKAKLKQTKEAIGKGDYPTAYRLAKGILDFESQNYTAWIFLGVACQNQENWEEGESAYKRAIDVDDSQLLAWQGLASLYEKLGNDEALGPVLEKLAHVFYSGHQPEKLLTILQKQLALAERSQDTPKIITAWCHLAGDGTYGSVISAASAKPSDTTVWQRVIDLQEEWDRKTVEREVKTRRSRLGAEPLVILRPRIEKEVMAASQLPQYCRS